MSTIVCVCAFTFLIRDPKGHSEGSTEDVRKKERKKSLERKKCGGGGWWWRECVISLCWTGRLTPAL